MDVIRRSFQAGISADFCGVENYKTIFSNEAFLLAVKNTVVFAGISIPLLIVISLLIALALNECKWIQMLKSAYLFPMAVPTATVVIVWKMLFFKGGLFNTGLENLGLNAVDWMGSNAVFAVLVISYLWKNIGYTVILWLAGILSVPKSILEAAKMDGANKRQRFRYVLMPNLKPMLYTITVLSFLNSFKVFREAYLVAGAYPQKSIYLLQHLFNNWFTNVEISKMSAAAVCIALVLGGTVFLLQYCWDKMEE